jgi:methylthioribose-1-phosphate isomerase
MPLVPLRWDSGRLQMLDQRRLPVEEVWLELKTHEDVAKAIREMAVRGAPAIGVAAAYGLALAAQNGVPRETAKELLAASRPTAVNLFWALDRIARLPSWDLPTVLAEAEKIEREDLEMNQRIGELGATLINPGSKVLTVCNTGSLATAGHGTALGIIRTAYAQGRVDHVYACETRPRQQGLRLTAYELMHDQIPFHAIADGAAGYLMKLGRVDCVIAGADRIASNGDTANKIGTYSLAVLARHHKIPFYIAAPSSTLDPMMKSGNEIPIEERSSTELTHVEGVQVGPVGVDVWNPGFDVTPGQLIEAIVTEKGIHRAPFDFKPSECRAESAS